MCSDAEFVSPLESGYWTQRDVLKLRVQIYQGFGEARLQIQDCDLIGQGWISACTNCRRLISIKGETIKKIRALAYLTNWTARGRNRKKTGA